MRNDPNRGLRLLNEMLGLYIDALQASRGVEVDLQGEPDLPRWLDSLEGSKTQPHPTAQRRPVPSRRPVQVHIDV